MVLDQREEYGGLLRGRDDKKYERKDCKYEGGRPRQAGLVHRVEA